MDAEHIKRILYRIIGEKELDHFIAKRKEKHMTSNLIRQMFMTSVMVGISVMKLPEIAEICSFGKDFDTGDYRDATLVTDGTNGWSAVFISTSDSGLVMLQKIAVATLLKNLIDLINGDQPVLKGTVEETNSWYPFQLRPFAEIQADADKGNAILLTLGW